MKKWVLSCVAMLVMALTTTLASPASAPALRVPGLAGTLEITSEAGDHVGRGERWSYSTLFADHFSAEGAGSYIDIGVSRNPGRPGPEIDYWQLRFEAPAGQRLERGTYRAARDPLRDRSLAGMDVWGHGRGCNLGGGTFTVDQVVRDVDDRTVLFVATFEQRCEPSAPALRGTIRVRAGRVRIGEAVVAVGSTAGGPPAGGVPVTGAFLAGEAGDYVSGGRSMWFPTVRLVRQEGTTRVGFVVTAPDHGFSIDLAAPPGEPLRPGGWEAERTSFRAAGWAGVDVSGEHRGCSSLRGRLVVDDATFDAAGALRSFSARFQQRCVAEGGPVLFGSLSWRSSVPYRARRLEVQRSLPGTPRLATITNQAAAPLDVHAIGVVGRGADGYRIAVDRCSGARLVAGGSCTVVVTGQPSAEAAFLAITDDFAAGFRVRLDRDGVVSP